MDTELVEGSEVRAEGSETRAKGSSKRAGEELEQESSKKQKLEKNKESEELKQCLEIVFNDEMINYDATPLSTKSLTIGRIVGIKRLHDDLEVTTAKIEENILSSYYCLYTVNAAGVKVTTAGANRWYCLDFLRPVRPMIPLYGEWDRTIMKFIMALVECSSSPSDTISDIFPNGQDISPLNPRGGVVAGVICLGEALSDSLSCYSLPRSLIRCDSCPDLTASMCFTLIGRDYIYSGNPFRFIEVKQHVSTSVKEIDNVQLEVVNQAELKLFSESFFSFCIAA
ncbi:hypothetical protein Tco_1401522 [Tanacetum coccineum]